MTLQQLRFLIAVAESGSINAAILSIAIYKTDNRLALLSD